MSVLTRLEVDVMVASELDESARLATKYKLPALVVHPGLAAEGHIARGRVGGKYRIITPIDWPKGETFGMPKMIGLNTDALEADGFEVLLTPGKGEGDTRNEIKSIVEFMRNHLGQLVEIRFVMGTLARSTEQVESQTRAFKGLPTPSLLRNDVSVVSQVGKANPDIHNSTIESINNIFSTPIKISGNINNLKTIANCKKAARFGVNLLQAKQIIKEFNSQPERVKELLVDTKNQVPDLPE